jgi:hypothetical protein
MANSTSKPRPTDQEALYLINMRRERANAVINETIHDITRTIAMPNSEQILEYLSNMSMCMEMMLKLLSGDWRSHDVSKMYEIATGAPHPKPAFMASLKDAIMNQKYLLSPAGRIIEYVPELELLNDFLLLAQGCDRRLM